MKAEMYFEDFNGWMKARAKTKADLRYWNEEEKAAAEFAWLEAWDNAKKSHDEEVKALKARIKLLEEECAWLDSVGKVGETFGENA